MYFSKSFYGYFLVIVLLDVAVRALLTDQDEVDKREGRPWRLPNTSYPIKYQLHITTWIHREILNFTGNVAIELMVKESTSELVLHAKDLEIQSVSIQDVSTKKNIGNLNARFIDDLLVIGVEKKNEADIFITGHHLRLEIHYSGVIKDKKFGFQTITYEIEEKKKIYGAYTHMEPIYARTVLPCYDEPALKAPFSVSITHGSNYTAISNMPAITTRKNDADDMITTTFAETPKMCTYLLAFVVSNFEFISKESDGILHRVFRPPNANDRGELALENSIKAMQTFGRYFDIGYALPKMDHADVHLFQYAGMENWGLITYAKNAFLETKNFEQINTQNHEIAHQWFGNLVSPMWWDSIWLNEGLATYYSYKLTDMLYPELNAMVHFEDSNCNKDINEAVIEYVEKPADIKRKFGRSSYSKAPCLLHLLNTIIGEETFLRGIKDYLTAHEYSNANSDQFFQRIQNAVDYSSETFWKINVTDVMKPYFTRSRNPDLTIYRNYSDSNKIHIKQSSEETELDGSTKFWSIPMSFAKRFEKSTPSIKYIMPPIPEVTLDLRKFNLTFRKSDWITVSIPGVMNYFIDYRGKE